MLSAKQSAALLRKYRIPTAKSTVVADEDGAARAAKKIGYPVAIKVDSEDIIHKTDSGVVAFGLENERELRAAFKRVMHRAGKAKVRGVVVQENLTGTEIIIGGKHDSQFGETVLFGIGGIFVEVFKDVALRVTPFSRKEAGEMVREIKGYPILQGTRGKKGVNTRAIVDTIMKVQRLMDDNEIAELDINPLFADEKGVKAVDVRVIMR